MGFKDKFSEYFTDAYMQKYGDRLQSATGTVLSVKTEESHILGIIRKLYVSLVVKPEVGKSVVKVVYKPKKWFKKPESIEIKQGNKVLVMGLKGEKDLADSIIASNIVNLTTNKSIHEFDRNELKKARQQAVKMRHR